MVCSFIQTRIGGNVLIVARDWKMNSLRVYRSSAREPWDLLDDVPKADDGGKSMFHLIWYILIGLISGVIAKSVMHTHMTVFWTIVLGIIGSVIGGAVTHLLFRSRNERYHPAGLIFSTLGAILVLFICYKLNIQFPQVVISR
jgi:uncharacterized membrane protein YeaQ/YmgE (transglycosylase-associated protein family)